MYEESCKPYKVTRQGSELSIVDKETGKIVTYIGYNRDEFPMDGREWEVHLNEYYVDENDQIKKRYGYRYIGDQ